MLLGDLEAGVRKRQTQAYFKNKYLHRVSQPIPLSTTASTSSISPSQLTQLMYRSTITPGPKKTLPVASSALHMMNLWNFRIFLKRTSRTVIHLSGGSEDVPNSLISICFLVISFLSQVSF